MLASYILSRTLVPTLAKYWLKPHENLHDQPEKHEHLGRLKRFQLKFEEKFAALRKRYHRALESILNNSKGFVIIFLAFIFISIAVLAPWLGSDFFPEVDAGQIKLHMRAHSGTRVEETASLADAVDEVVRDVIPKDELQSIVHNIGLAEQRYQPLLQQLGADWYFRC